MIVTCQKSQKKYFLEIFSRHHILKLHLKNTIVSTILKRECRTLMAGYNFKN